MDNDESAEQNGPAALPEDTPVTMPDLPLSLDVDTPRQMKALADPIRHRILGIIQSRPATAKQIADRLKMPPGTIGHHLQVLESAGLAQVVARRLVRGIVAKYYTRTARIFTYNFPDVVTGKIPALVRLLTDARGATLIYNRPVTKQASLVAANPGLHSEIVALLNGRAT